jgi:fumarylpyruvate hydrolase
MIFSVAELIAYVSRFITLEPGDLLFTGTPAGVGPIVEGDVLEGFINGKRLLNVTVGKR